MFLKAEPDHITSQLKTIPIAGKIESELTRVAPKAIHDLSPAVFYIFLPCSWPSVLPNAVTPNSLLHPKCSSSVHASVHSPCRAFCQTCLSSSGPLGRLLLVFQDSFRISVHDGIFLVPTPRTGLGSLKHQKIKILLKNAQSDSI